MISSRISPSVAMGEVACTPGEYSATDLKEMYTTSSPNITNLLAISSRRNWLRATPATHRNVGAPRKLLSPTDLFWNDFRQINGNLRADLTTGEQELLIEATEARSLSNRTVYNPGSREHLQARSILLGGAALLSERYSLDNYGWFEDSQAMLSLIAVNASLLSPTDVQPV